ncbi:hypothetical protein [Spartinivicinus poritis]|uniref:Uncharacterized protein n=1 Tax=Spartinivicinus poritis TaxID=2994640 RepID=A0ABT5U7C0_9GAMM|nr:hypothetical protein [Spartinivicinus sp. A2-2]MDE1462265.1 hypothetical protein [Spartinivicinus sp. A2-2]
MAFNYNTAKVANCTHLSILQSITQNRLTLADVLALIVGSVYILYINHPFYLFADASVIGWYDEFDLGIVHEMLYLKSGALDFNHQMAGGASLASSNFHANGLNIYHYLCQAIGLKWGTITFRLAGQWLFFITLYFWIRSLCQTQQLKFQQSSTIFLIPALSCIGSLLAAYSQPYVYGWALAGYGYTFISLSLFALIVLSGNLTFYSKLTVLLFLALLQSSLFSMVVVFAFQLPSFLLLAALLMKDNRKLNYRQIIFFCIIAEAAVMLFSISEVSSILAIADESARLNRFDNFNALFNRNGLSISEAFMKGVENFTNAYYSGLFSLGKIEQPGLFPNPTGLLLILGCIIVIHVAIFKKLTAIFLFVLFFIVSYGHSLLSVFPFFSTYRWDQIAIFNHQFFVLLAIPLLVNIYQWPASGEKNIILLNYFGKIIPVICCMLFSYHLYVSSYNMLFRTYAELKSGNTWATSKAITLSAEQYTNHRSFSYSTYNPKPEFGIFWGLNMLDGVRPSFSWRRTAFWFHTLSKTEKSNWHTHRQTNFSLNGTHFPALSMGSVRYVISSVKLPQFSNEKQLIKSKSVCEYTVLCSVFDYVNSKLKPISAVKDVYMYELEHPWEMAFYPSNIIISDFSDTTPEYFNQLKHLEKHNVLFPTELSQWINKKVHNKRSSKPDITFSSNGYILSNILDSSLVILNQEYSQNWTAYCDTGKAQDVVRAEIVPVNGIMMAIKIPNKCKSLRVTYNNKSLLYGILGLIKPDLLVAESDNYISTVASM